MMQPWMGDVVYLVVALGFGGLGSVLRMCVQYKRDGVWLSTGFALKNEVFLGCAAGLVIWLTALFPDFRALAVCALTAGLSAVDTIENLVESG